MTETEPSVPEEELQLIGDGLYLNYRQFLELPRQLFDEEISSSLRRLYVKHNLLKSLPAEIKSLQHLTELYLHSNGLVSLPEELGELIHLELLGVSDNQLTCLPASICRLQHLKRLQASRNQITHLPSDIGDLRELQSLEMSYNRLRKLPAQLSCCDNLRQLSVDSNHLVSVPRQLCRLPKLTQISACDNHLASLPQDLGCMPALGEVYVDNNPFLTAVPASLLRKTVGYCGSGSSPVPDQLLHLHRHVVIRNGQGREMIVLMPPEIRSLGQHCTDCVPLLFELALRRLSHVTDGHVQEEEVPAECASLLQTPTGHCGGCGLPVFVCAFPAVFREPGQAPHLALCCSSACVRQCLFNTNLPLLFPRMEDLSLALVLV